jgi:predicted MPP superfamily phosphohydrolase
MRPIFKRPFNRRDFIRYSLRLSVFAFLGFMYTRRNNVKIEPVRLAFSNLPPAFNNFKIVLISDLHASFWVGEDYLMSVVDRVNHLEKDLVVVTGDIITGAVNDFWKRWLPVSDRDYTAMVSRVLGHLKPGNKLAVLGNHDQWDGLETEKRLVSELEKIDIPVLRNNSVPISRGKERLYVAGIDDVWFTYDLTRAMRDVPAEAFKILLSHSPDIMSDVSNEMQVDLTLCGHTHGGQLAIPYLSHHFLPIDNPQRYMAGLVKEPYGYTYVNRGIGTLVFPLRLGAPPEITHIRLVSVHK